MRDSYGGAWLFGLVITFMIIFVGFLTVMISYSIAFKTKNEVVAIIEKYEGFVTGNYTAEDIYDADGNLVKNSPNSQWLINNYLVNSGYANKGICSCASDNSEFNYCYGVSDLSNYNNIERINRDSSKASKKYFYCLQFIDKDYDDYERRMGYYNVELFFNFDIPIINTLRTFSVKGQTIKIKNVNVEGLDIP